MSITADPVDERTNLVVPIEQVHIVDGFNARTIDTTGEDFKGLVESIRAMGVLVPLIVTVGAVDNDMAYKLVAGHRRLMAAREAGLTEVPVIVRDAATAEADAAVENMTRSDLWPLEEANAIKAMIDNGYTEEGAAQVLGVSKRLVWARLQLFRLPERTRSYFGPEAKEGHMPTSVVPKLVAVAEKSPELCDAAADLMYSQRRFSVDGWLLRGAASECKAFVEVMSRLHESDLRESGPKKLRELYAELEKARPKHGYSPPLHFQDEDVDQARAAGVLIEFDSGHDHPLILDKKLYTQLRNQALARELPLAIEQAKASKKSAAKASKKKDPATGEPVPPTPRELAEQAYSEAAKTWPASARAVNGELGASLLNGLASVPVDMNVARFFVFGLLGLPASFNAEGKYLNMGYGSDQKAVTLARAGMRLCHPELVTVQSTTLKSGKPGKDKITYATDKECEEWLWKFLGGAKTPEELFGRALVLYAASDHAVQEAVSVSQRGRSGVPASKGAVAHKALTALVKPHVPAAVKKLRAAMAKAEKARSEVPADPPQRPDVPEGEWVGDDE